MDLPQIAIFASGAGTNAARLMAYFAGRARFCVFSNRAESGVLARAAAWGVGTVVFDRRDFFETTRIRDLLLEQGTDLVVLAGFLWKVPEGIIADYPGRIINIHPSLLPKFGGRGMYGQRVHEQVLAAGEPMSGITIHHVTAEYDQGAALLQATCPVLPTDDAHTLAERIHALEYRYYPQVVEQLLESQKR